MSSATAASTQNAATEGAQDSATGSDGATQTPGSATDDPTSDPTSDPIGETGDTSGGALDCPLDDLACGVTSLASCNMADVGLCFEYYHDCVTGAEAEAGCTDFGGVWVQGACPAQDQLGICLNGGLVQSGLAAYAVPGATEADTQTGCEDGGGLWCSAGG